jgi:hypothetical protein
MKNIKNSLGLASFGNPGFENLPNMDYEVERIR